MMRVERASESNALTTLNRSCTKRASRTSRPLVLASGRHDVMVNDLRIREAINRWPRTSQAEA